MREISGLSPRVRGNRAWRRTPPPCSGSIPACAGEPNAPRLLQGKVRVYPRVCGGTIYEEIAQLRTEGLSPRVRGNPRPATRTSVSSGSIPACAGEPARQSPTSTAPRVYPRVCGGTNSQTYRLHLTEGLSPRVRGNPGAARCLLGHGGSIPACAGEPSARSCWPLRRRVYPRVCGGTLPVDAEGQAFEGLSPRVRGNPALVRVDAAGQGSIPACAGEPRRRGFGAGALGVYPRVCGGTGIRVGRPIAVQGLSPRVRGNRLETVQRRLEFGSIPACAGEPAKRRPPRKCRRVYPRVCGGTRSVRGIAQGQTGLSPRVRGNRNRRLAAGRGAGSIPACAGEPPAHHLHGRGHRVYPRVCGGTVLPCNVDPLRAGLSPRVRGNRPPLRPLCARRGSIPACAGEPRRASAAASTKRVYPRVCGGTNLVV